MILKLENKEIHYASLAITHSQKNWLKKNESLQQGLDSLLVTTLHLDTMSILFELMYR